MYVKSILFYFLTERYQENPVCAEPTVKQEMTSL